MKKVIILLYGVVTYVMFLLTFLYMIGFMGNLLVPKGIDDGVVTPFATALCINVSLILLFGIQHTIMARPPFKRWFTSVVPESAERTTFVLVTNLILILIFWQWRPMPETVWAFEGTVVKTILYTLFALGWGVVLLSTFLIDHFDLFGLRQVFLPFIGREYTPPPVKVVSLYRVVRNPLMLGFLISFWTSPVMSVGHLVFSTTFTLYILVGISFEERTLLEELDDEYRDYRNRTPMLIPWGIFTSSEAQRERE